MALPDSPAADPSTPLGKASSAAVAEDTPKKYASRDDWFAAAGRLREEEHHIEGLGLTLFSEIDGKARALIMSAQSKGLLDEHDKNIDHESYQKTLILSGVVDPSSPPGARRPLFREGDLDRIMQIGSSKIAEVVDHIERLSILGKYAASAEGNSKPSPNGASTSG